MGSPPARGYAWKLGFPLPPSILAAHLALRLASSLLFFSPPPSLCLTTGRMWWNEGWMQNFCTLQGECRLDIQFYCSIILYQPSLNLSQSKTTNDLHLQILPLSPADQNNHR